jgi:hypothetical protein
MSRRKIYTISEINEYISKRNGKCLSTDYKNNKAKLKFLCFKCKLTWFNCFKNIKLLNNWCPHCSGKYNNNLEIIRKLAIERNGKCLSTEYKNNKTNLKWECNKCLNVWFARLDRIKSGTWCPRCKESRGERIVANCLDKLNISYIREKCITGIEGVRNLRFDFYLPTENIAIEYDGIQHFAYHNKYSPDDNTLKEKHKLDIIKTLYCNNNKIKLLRIDYKSLNKIHLFLKEYLDIMLNSKDFLYFTAWEEYNFIFEKLDKNIEFSLLLTGVGKL